MSQVEVYLAAACTAAALCWQLAWGRRLWALSDGAAGRVVYFAVRTALAFVMCWLNSFFSFFALMGYFDANRHLPRSHRWWGLLATAATLAGSQSSMPDGPPPDDVVELVVFSALFTLHATLALVLDRFNDREAENRQKREATIEELEVANARLTRALDENAARHAQLVVQAREAGVTARTTTSRG